MNDNALIQSFDSDLQIATQLLELLDAEFEALTQHDLANLQSLLDQKQPLLSLLNQHAQERSQLLQAHGFSADKDGLNHWIAQSSNGSSIEEKAQALSLTLERLQHSNQRNGKVIRSSQASVNSVLGILGGNRSSEIPNLYDSKGSTARIASNKPLSQA